MVPTMARPVAADAEVTRARILAAATALFSKAPAADVSIREVGKAAGVTLATVHHYFGTKEQLYAACVSAMHQELETLRAELEPLVLAPGDRRSQLSAVVQASFAFARRHAAAIRFMLRTVVDTGAMDPLRLKEVHLPFLANSAAVFEAVLGVKADDARLLVQSLMHLVVRYAITAPEELVAIAGVSKGPNAVARAERRISEHLATLALLGLGPEATL